MDISTLKAVYLRQAHWFAGERSRLLRKVGIAGKRCVLDLGTGTGALLPELQRRCGGEVIGVDRDPAVLREAAGAGRVIQAEATALPFPDAHFDLVFAQMFFLWATPLEAVVAELRRVLIPGGHLLTVAEPDYGGAIEHPDAAGALHALARRLAAEGADIHIARKLGSVLRRTGFTVACGSHPVRPLEAAGEEDLSLPEPRRSDAPREFLFVPYFHFLAR